MLKTYSAIIVLGSVLGCSPAAPPSTTVSRSDQPAAEATPAAAVQLIKLTSEHLPNPVQVHPKVISGGLPDGDAGYRELSELGIKTIISVDGAKPDVEAARKYGMRYVHLPHGYDGISEERTKELGKAVRDLEGPIYIHCHHGKHRSPAAASVACVTAGLIAPSAAVPALELAGTSANYRGLYQSAEQAKPQDPALLDALDVEFRETVEVAPMAEAMVELGHTHENMQLIAQAGWKTPPKHPDLDPAHEALLLQEHFTELLRTDEVEDQPAEFRRLLVESETDARALESELRQWQTSASGGPVPASIGQLADRISTNCKICHEKFRDTPLGQK